MSKVLKQILKEKALEQAEERGDKLHLVKEAASDGSVNSESEAGEGTPESLATDSISVSDLDRSPLRSVLKNRMKVPGKPRFVRETEEEVVAPLKKVSELPPASYPQPSRVTGILTGAVVLSLLAAFVYFRARTPELTPTADKTELKRDVPLAQINENNEAVRQYTNLDYTGAAATLEKLVVLYPQSAPLRVNLGTTYGKLKNFAKAKQHLEEAARLEPKEATTFNNLGMLYLTKGDLVAAEESFRTAIKLNPSVADTHLNFGRLYEKSKRYDDAKHEYGAYLQSSAASPILKKLIKRRIEKLTELEKTLKRILEEDHEGT